MGKIVSQLDVDGYFVAPVLAAESPLEPGVFLIPGGAVDRNPPAALLPGKRYRPWGAGWRAEDLPAPVVAPEAPAPTAAELRRAEILGRLGQIDAETVRPAREVAAALVEGVELPAFSRSKLLALEAEAAGLRAELRGL